MTVCEFRYGTGYDRVVRLEYGLRDVRTDREPREASEWLRSPTGAEDATLYGFDYTMDAVAQFVPWNDKDPVNTTPISGPDSWRSFLDAVRDKQPFRFVPDAAYPLFYVDNCFLDSPVRGGGTPRTPTEWDVAFKIRNPNHDFVLALRGLIFEIAPELAFPETAQSPEVFSLWRGSTALYDKEDGSVGEAAVHELRHSHYGTGGRGILVESAATNFIENGGYEQDANGTGANACTRVRDATNVRHGSWACKVTTTNTGGSGVFWQTRASTRIAAVAARAYSFTVDVYAPAAAVGKVFNINFEWYLAGGGANGANGSSNLTLVAGWQRFKFTFTSPANTAFIVPTFYTNGAQGVFDFWVDLATLIERAYPMQPISTSTGQVTRDNDRYAKTIRLSMAMDWTIYLEFWPQHGLTSWPDTEPNLDACIFSLWPDSVNPDSATGDTKALRLHRQNAFASYEWEYAANTPTASRTFTPGTAVQKLTMRHYASDHHLDLAIDGSAFASSGVPAAQLWETLTLLRFFSLGFSEVAADGIVRRMKCAPGLRTQAQMEAL